MTTQRISLTRSIPAHAGEPSLSASASVRRRVYPRPRGGTYCRTKPSAAVVGLSPPTRGNPLHGIADFNRKRSIPAHAGEP